MIEAIQNFFTSELGVYFGGIIISMIPLIELKGGLPFIYFFLGKGSFANLSIAFGLSFLGSSLVVPILLLIFMPIINWLKKTKFLKGLAEKVENHFKKKSVELENKAEKNFNKSENSVNDGAVLSQDEEAEKQRLIELKKKKIEKYKYWGLFVFTAIPLPLTGAWTASAVAAILGLDYKKSLFYIVLGNLVCALAVAIVAFTLGVAL